MSVKDDRMHLKKEMTALIEKTDEEKCNCVKQKRSTDDNLIKLKGSKNRVMITIKHCCKTEWPSLMSVMMK